MAMISEGFSWDVTETHHDSTGSGLCNTIRLIWSARLPCQLALSNESHWWECGRQEEGRRHSISSLLLCLQQLLLLQLNLFYCSSFCQIGLLWFQLLLGNSDLLLLTTPLFPFIPPAKGDSSFLLWLISRLFHSVSWLHRLSSPIYKLLHLVQKHKSSFCFPS